MTNEDKYIKDLEVKLNSIAEKCECMEEKINKIHTAIVGDERYGYLGLVKLVESHDKWISNQKFRIAYISGAVGITWTLLLKFWDKIFG